ncbi:hypothetical protein TWF481_001154 [Arthrobotrys musiformis]|uniref:Uncharacterized protein n=1 Tax=Arthrobotrys musiformis TaxID=47236 RepID=A0AAV9WPQ6_9PEZI
MVYKFCEGKKQNEEEMGSSLDDKTTKTAGFFDNEVIRVANGGLQQQNEEDERMSKDKSKRDEDETRVECL